MSFSASTELLLQSLCCQPGNVCRHNAMLHSVVTVACVHAQVLICAVVLTQCLVSPDVAMQVCGRLPDQEGAQPLSAAGMTTGSGVQPLPARQRTAASLQVQLDCSYSQVLCCRSACHSSTLLQATCLVDISWLPCYPSSSCHSELSMVSSMNLVHMVTRHTLACRRTKKRRKAVHLPPHPSWSPLGLQGSLCQTWMTLKATRQPLN